MSLAICISSGPSLTQEDVDYCRGKGKVYVVNDCYKLAPWADVLYAADGPWWDFYGGAAGFDGEKWTLDTLAAAHWELSLIGHRKDIDWSDDKNFISTGGRLGGGNSGFQALNLAAIHGAEKIILLGYDMGFGENGERHWFGNHPTPLHKDSRYDLFGQSFVRAAPHIKQQVINCSRRTALDCFPKAELKSVL